MDNSKLLNRIKRVKGQVEGIEKMVKNKRKCLQVIQQITAVRAALAKIGGMILAEESCSCEKNKKPEEFEYTLKELVKNL